MKLSERLSFNKKELATLKRAFSITNKATDKIINDNNFDSFELSFDSFALWMVQTGLRDLLKCRH